MRIPVSLNQLDGKKLGFPNDRVFAAMLQPSKLRIRVRERIRLKHASIVSELSYV